MITLRSIEKTYDLKEKKVRALKGVSLSFRKSEFVCILGHSGCGKTTLLNVLGGLDKYTSGDLLIGGRSTVDFTDGDWDTYRSNKVGFVFQSYNLISHQTVLENVEMALVINGVGKEERRKRAIDALVKVGLSEHLRKKPRQLSGGEMQRVAIARAIVNEPDIILADEPTGALDSANSVAIMDILKEISKDRLVITVTHNAELAEQYATRIVKMADGKLVSDSNPYKEEKEEIDKESDKRSVMPYSLALKLSFKNLLGKKVRSVLIAVASAIGIVGVALVLACSNGLNYFVDKVQRDTMSSTPVTVSAEGRDYSATINTILGYVTPDDTDMSSIPTDSVIINHTLKNAVSSRVYNNITEDYLNYISKLDKARVSYDEVYSVNKFVYKSISIKIPSVKSYAVTVNVINSSARNWIQLPNDTSSVYEQYDLVGGKFPTGATELALVVDKYSSVSDAILTSYFLDISSSDEDKTSYTFDEVLSGRAFGKFALLSPDEYYVSNGSGGYTPNTVKAAKYLNDYYKPESSMQEPLIERDLRSVLGDTYDSINCYNKDPNGEVGGTELKIVGILRLKEDAQYGMFTTSPIVYTEELTKFVISSAKESELVKEQMASTDADVISGKKNITLSEYKSALNALGYAESPNQIRFYPKTLSDKDYLLSYLNKYNDGKTDEESVKYVDNVGAALEIVRTIINTIEAILIALTSISLIVSSIMIGIITYISVIERTKEIGILRSVGARKKDVIRLFITETGMIGLVAGAVGILVNAIAQIPLNSLMKSITGVSGFVFLSWWQVLVLLGASTLLSILAGLIPSIMASRRDPVKALRAE